MYANDIVHAPFEDQACFDSDCYSPCGNIAKPEGFDRYRTDVIVRKYHMYLQDLHNEIDYGNHWFEIYCAPVFTGQPTCLLRLPHYQ